MRLNAPRFLTLTLPAVDAPLATQLRVMRTAFSRLRRSGAWVSHVVGGLYSIQITRNTKTGLWHPHLHCIVDGEFWPVAEIRHAWRAAINATSGPWKLDDSDPLIVDIRAVPDRAKAGRYIARYVCSPNDIAGWPAACIREYLKGTHGMRMLTMFGSLHGVKSAADDDEAAFEAAEFVTTIETIERHVQAGDDVTRAAVRLLARAVPSLRHVCPWASPHDGESGEPPDAAEISMAIGQLRTRYMFGFDAMSVQRNREQAERAAKRARELCTLFDEALKHAA